MAAATDTARRQEEFTLYVRPTFGANNPGFDRLRLGSSSVAPIELVDVRSGSESLLRLGGGRQLWPGPVRVERTDDEEIDLLFAEPVQRGTLYAIRLRTEVYMGNTQFFAALSNSQWPDRLQQISPGNATDLVASQSLGRRNGPGRQRLAKRRRHSPCHMHAQRRRHQRPNRYIGQGLLHSRGRSAARRAL